MMKLKIFTIWVVFQIQIQWNQAQQSYVNNKQLDCYNHFNTTDGFVCNGVSPTCLSYLTFRSIPPYNSPSSIAFLLGSDTVHIAKANNISDVDTIPTNNLVIVPVNCSCTAGDDSSYYQHNASYILKLRSETYFSVANNTYQGLTTCQSLIAQNSVGIFNLSVGLTLQIPLRCACPTRSQTSSAVKYLLLYLVTWHDSYSTIAARFGVKAESLLDANRLSSSDNIYPFTPLIVPLTTEPSLTEPASPPPPPPPPAQPPISPNHNSSNKWIVVGAAIGAALLFFAAIAFFFFFIQRRRRHHSNTQKPKELSSSLPPSMKVSSNSYSTVPGTSSSSWSTVSNQGALRSAADSLTIYKLEELQKATDFFSEKNKIRGSVYRGSFNGDEAAIKVMKGDVSGEINILKRINHLNIIRLSGLCVSGGNSYLVYEYAQNGSLSDWLQQHNNNNNNTLSWKQRVEIAYDVADAINYLHNFANPPYIHKNLKTSNIVLDETMKAKVTNFGLARVVENDEEEHNQPHLTRHVVGTQGYMAPEYIESGLVTSKLDVFAYGVVLLEILSGRAVAAAGDGGGGEKGEELVSEWVIRNVLDGDNVREKLREFMDAALKREYPLDLAFTMAQLAKACVARDLNSRPAITEVLMTLSKIRSSTRDWDPSDELQHSSSRSFSHW
ncbi:hypothetical protein CsatB_007878 [Cannabis sativa]